MTAMITPHISENEVACKCCKVIKYNIELAYVVEWLREELNKQFKNVIANITSWHRCEKNNKAVGGAKSSKHLTGDAVDVFFTRKDGLKKVRIEYQIIMDLLKKYPKAIKFGFGVYENNRVHIDIRAISAKWDNR